MLYQTVPHADDFKGWSSSQLQVFLQHIVDLQKQAFDAAKEPHLIEEQRKRFAALLTRMDEVHDLTKSKNSEVRFKWLTVSCLSALA